jgi:hypothetical protein
MGWEVFSLLCLTERGVFNPRANGMLGGCGEFEQFMSGPVRANKLQIHDAKVGTSYILSDIKLARMC